MITLSEAAPLARRRLVDGVRARPRARTCAAASSPPRALSVAVVLGEFTIASLLSRVNLQTSLLLVSQSDPFVAVIFALLALVFAFLLLVVVDRLVSARRRRPAKG